MKLTERAEMLINNDHNWYVVTMTDGTYILRHASMLSSVLQCGAPLHMFGYAKIEQCWDGEDLTTEDDYL